ncbi:hypothetical protein A152_0024070, partial [Vibrio tasmaniensis 1F-187]
YAKRGSSIFKFNYATKPEFGPDSDSVHDRMHNAINAIYQKALYLSTLQEQKYRTFEEQRT